jgi:K+-sensing histidine kinase KdpD
MFRTYRQRFAFFLALAAPLGVVVVLIPVRGNFTNTAAALVLVAGVVAIAVLGSRVSGFVASISAALWFDLSLTRPYYQFAIRHRPDLETTIAIFVVGVIVTELAARSRHHSRVSNEESTYVSMIRDLTDLAARSSKSAVVIESVERSLVPLLDLRACHFDPTLADHPLARIIRVAP